MVLRPDLMLNMSRLFRMMAMEELKREMPELAQDLMKGQIARARALVQQPKQN